MTALTLLGDVRWRGAPVAGERSQALLAALAAARGRPVRAERLIDLVWGDDAPADAAKGLQVLVSRTRTAWARARSCATPPATGSASTRARSTPSGSRALVRDASAALDDDADRAATLAARRSRWATGCPRRVRTRPTR